MYLPAMQETWVLSLVWEDPLEKGTATHSSVLTGEFHELYIIRVHGVAKSWKPLNDFHFSLSHHAYIRSIFIIIKRLIITNLTSLRNVDDFINSYIIGLETVQFLISHKDVINTKT